MLGSARTMVQAGGTSVCYDGDFFPFGGERIVTSTCSQSYKFEGKERDTETGNDDFGARYYASRLGRWLSADWSAVPAPVPYANLTNPQTLNLYAMVSDNPETFADLDGHTCTYSPLGQENCKDTANRNANAPATTGEGHPAPQRNGTGVNQDTLTGIQVALQWFDVFELSGSVEVGASVGGQIGTVEGKAGVGAEFEATVGVGGGNGEISAFGGAQASAKAGLAEAEIKAGGTASTKDGLGVSADAHANAGPAGAGVKADRTGLHAYASIQHKTDFKLGGHVTGGIGVGVNINFSQANRAFHATVAWFGSIVTRDIPALSHLP